MATTSKVSAYLQHLETKKTFNNNNSSNSPNRSNKKPLINRSRLLHGALDRRRKRAAQVRASLVESRSTPAHRGTIQSTTSQSTASPRLGSNRTPSTTTTTTFTKPSSPPPPPPSNNLLGSRRQSNGSTTATYVSSSSSSSDSSEKSQTSLSHHILHHPITALTTVMPLQPTQTASNWFPNDPLGSSSSSNLFIHEEEDEDESSHPSSSYADNSHSQDPLEALIAETSERWRCSTEQVVQNTTTRKSLSGLTMPKSTSNALVAPQLTSSVSAPLLTQLVCQADIDGLRQELTDRQRRRASATFAPPPAAYPPEDICIQPFADEEEDIDHVPPMPDIEICLDTTVQDDITVWSGWTKAASSAVHPKNTAAAAIPLTRRPEADDAGSLAAAPMQRRVHDYAISLTAANGAVRRALYTGPLQNQTDCTGVGHLQFVDTGDAYHGMVVRGEMHGMGTYTSQKNRVLKGVFEHNVFVQWE